MARRPFGSSIRSAVPSFVVFESPTVPLLLPVLLLLLLPSFSVDVTRLLSGIFVVLREVPLPAVIRSSHLIQGAVGLLASVVKLDGVAVFSGRCVARLGRRFRML